MWILNFFKKKKVEEVVEEKEKVLMTLHFVFDDGSMKSIVNVETESFNDFCDNNSNYEWITFNDININTNKVNYYYVYKTYTEGERIIVDKESW